MIASDAMFSDRKSPLVIRPADSERDLSSFARGHKEALEELLWSHGALLFRGFDVASAGSFSAFADAISRDRIDYLYRSTPRTAVGGMVFTASEYPPDEEIPLHNENAYQRSWPRKLAFCCLEPAASGGETPIADVQRVTASIPSHTLEKFETHGVEYIRHYHQGIDIPWQTVFQTCDKDVAQSYCQQHGIDSEWLEGDVFRTSQVCQGTTTSPATGETIFFNQAHLFHSTSLGERRAQMLRKVLGDRLPRHARFGDKSEIGIADLEAVRRSFQENSIAFPWCASDVLLLDNMQWAHGRRPYSGSRRVLAVLLDNHPATRLRESEASAESLEQGAEDQ